MKLYTINCYGVNYGIGNNEEDAVKAYLFNHPELQEVDDIENKLEAKLLLSEEAFEDIFAGLVIMYNDVGITNEMIRFITNKNYLYATGASLENILGIYEVFESMLDEVSIYSSYSMSIEDIIKCNMTLKEIEADYYDKNFKVSSRNYVSMSVDEESILKFLGFYELEDGNGTLQWDDDDIGVTFVYDDPTGTITEYHNGNEFQTYFSVGRFINENINR